MKKVLSYTIIVCLLAIILLILRNNKREINAQIAFAEKEVEAFPVEVEEVKLGTLDTYLEVSGIVSAHDDLMLMAETQGRVLKIYKHEGDWVAKGESIAQINDELMRAELMVTEANFEKAKKDLERAVTLSDGGAITQQQLEGLQLNEKAAKAKYTVSKKRVKDALIKAPISGYINKLFLKEGGMIGATVPACELVNIRSLKMLVKVDEDDVVKVFPGQEVEVRVASLNGETLTGSVVSVGSKADYALQYGVEIAIPDNPGEKLKAGMVANAKFIFVDDVEGPVITHKSILGSAKDPKVYVVNENRAVLRPVKIAHRNGEAVKLLSGLSEGEMLVTAGLFNLKDQMKVKVVENK